MVMNQGKIYVKLLPGGIFYKGTEGSAGYDLASTEDMIIQPKAIAKIPTGVHVSFPHGIFGLLTPRSSTSSVFELQVHTGIIDSDYCGQIFIAVKNIGDIPIEIQKGRRYAQLVPIILGTSQIEFVEVLPSTERGENGFGSTGI